MGVMGESGEKEREKGERPGVFLSARASRFPPARSRRQKHCDFHAMDARFGDVCLSSLYWRRLCCAGYIMDTSNKLFLLFVPYSILALYRVL